MNLKRPWIVAGTTLAIAGFGAGVAVAGPDVHLNDRGQAPVVQLSSAEASDRLDPADSPGSPDSAQSPADSPFDSGGSAQSPFDSVGTADSAHSAQSADSADSPG